jgi:hypothetical protein
MEQHPSMHTAFQRCHSFYFIMFVLVWSSVCIFGYGCTTIPRYQSKASSPVDGAMVRGTREFHLDYWYKLGLNRVDGKATKLSWWSDWTKPVLIDPGDRMLEAVCLFALGGSSTDKVTVDLAVSLQAGHNYQLRNGVENNAVVFWVEDVETHLLAGKKVTMGIAPSSPAKTAAQTAAGLLLRVLLLFGTGR